MINNVFKSILFTIAKLFLILISSYTMLIVLLISYSMFNLFFYPLFPSYTNKKEAKKLTQTIFGYFSLNDLELVYSIRHWNTMSYNICFVFNYPEGRYTAHNTQYSYIDRRNNYNKKFANEFTREVSKSQGCAKFISKLDRHKATLFKEFDYHHEYGRGGKVFINERDNLIMFEGYLYD